MADMENIPKYENSLFNIAQQLWTVIMNILWNIKDETFWNRKNDNTLISLKKS